MSEPLSNLKRYIGRKENASDIVTASAMLKIAAALGWRIRLATKAIQSRRAGTEHSFRGYIGQARCALMGKPQVTALSPMCLCHAVALAGCAFSRATPDCR
jgi:hypothetical protein